MTEISILEDNAGQVYLVANDKVWGLGPVTLDTKGQANVCAETWAVGEWEPNEDDGQVLYDQTLAEALVNLKLIGVWTAVKMSLIHQETVRAIMKTSRRRPRLPYSALSHRFHWDQINRLGA